MHAPIGGPPLAALSCWHCICFLWFVLCFNCQKRWKFGWFACTNSLEWLIVSCVMCHLKALADFTCCDQQPCCRKAQQLWMVCVVQSQTSIRCGGDHSVLRHDRNVQPVDWSMILFCGQQNWIKQDLTSSPIVDHHFSAQEAIMLCSFVRHEDDVNDGMWVKQPLCLRSTSDICQGCYWCPHALVANTPEKFTHKRHGWN